MDDFYIFLCVSCLTCLFFIYCICNGNIIKGIYNFVKKIQANINEHAEARTVSQILFQKWASSHRLKTFLETPLHVYETEHDIFLLCLCSHHEAKVFFSKTYLLMQSA